MENSEQLEDLILGSTDSEKLESAKEIIKNLEKDLKQTRSKLKTLENNLTKLENIQKNSSSTQNNTSSSFWLPSEFKQEWETLTTETTLDLFQDFLSSPNDFAFLSQQLSRIILESVETSLNSKLHQIQQELGSPPTSTETLKRHLLKLFQENSSTAFQHSKEKISKVFIRQLSKPLALKVKPLVSGQEFEDFVKSFHKISVFLTLNDSPLKVSFSEVPQVVTVKKAEDFRFIDGFATSNSKVVVVFPEVLRGQSRFLGIRPSVLVLPDEEKDSSESWNRINTEPSSEDSRKGVKQKIRFGSPKLIRKPLIPDCIFCRIHGKCQFCLRVSVKNEVKEKTEKFSSGLSQAAQRIDIKKFISQTDEKCEII